MSFNAASGFSGYLDTTLSCGLDDPRLPTLRADVTPVFATDRVIPLLLSDITTAMQVRQRIHLRLLLDNLDDLLTYDDSTDEEVEMLLVVLFSFAHRRGGFTPMQKRHNNEASDISFAILHRLFGGSHDKTPQALRCLRKLLSELGCTDTVFQPMEGSVAVDSEYNSVIDFIASKLSEIQHSLEKCTVEVENRKKSVVVSACLDAHKKSAGKQDYPFVHGTPFAYSVDRVAASDRFGFTEADFDAAVEWFSERPVVAGDNRDLISHVGEGSFIGTKYVSREQMVRLQSDSGTSLLDLLRLLFPLVPDATFLKRMHGVLLAQSEDTKILEDTSSIALPLIEELSTKLSAWLIRGKPIEDHHAVIHHIVEWHSALDISKQGHVTVEHLSGSNEWCAFITNAFLKLHKKQVSVFDVVIQAFPGELFDKVKEAFTLILRTVEKEYASRLKAVRVANIEYKLKLLHFVEGSGVGENPSGSPDTALTQAGHEAMRVIAKKLLEERRALESHRLEQVRLQSLAASLAREREITLKKQVDELRLANHSAVEVITGPPAPPPTIQVHGFQINSSILCLEKFAEPETRAQLSDILTRLDMHGVDPRHFLSDPSITHHFVPRIQSVPAKVFRDFYMSPARPSPGTWWQGNHALVITTNIKRHSDVKYRISIEGYNFGLNTPVNTVIVGYAAKSLDVAGTLETYGWPDGWDRHSILHLSNGIETITQTFDSNDYLTLQATAKSLTHVAFSVSIWLCNHEYGTDHFVAANVHHLGCQKRTTYLPEKSFGL